MNLLKNLEQDFFKTHPSCKTFVENLAAKLEDDITKVINDNKKRNLPEKANEICKFDVSVFKESILNGYKYKLELLKTDSSDYTKIEDSLKFENQSSVYEQDMLNEIKSFKLYRVVPNEKVSSKSSESNKTLMLHGTTAKNVQGILMNGFLPSNSGTYGPGVYMTNRYSVARNYSKSFASEKNQLKKFCYIFLNNIPNPQFQYPLDRSKKNLLLKNMTAKNKYIF